MLYDIGNPVLCFTISGIPFVLYDSTWVDEGTKRCPLLLAIKIKVCTVPGKGGGMRSAFYVTPDLSHDKGAGTGQVGRR